MLVCVLVCGFDLIMMIDAGREGEYLHFRAWVLLLEMLHEQLRLTLALVLYMTCQLVVIAQDVRGGEKGKGILFKSTMATSAPLSIHAWLITSPSPRAPPVITQTRLSSEKLANVRLKCMPPRPEMGWLGGWDSSSGCSI